MSVSVHHRGPGVAIVRDARSGRFVGRVIRIGTGWQSWRRDDVGRLVFVGWGSRRRDAVERLGG